MVEPDQLLSWAGIISGAFDSFDTLCLTALPDEDYKFTRLILGDWPECLGFSLAAQLRLLLDFARGTSTEN